MSHLLMFISLRMELFLLLFIINKMIDTFFLHLLDKSSARLYIIEEQEWSLVK
jgi:hypothetical protein